ncbi:6-phosphogluconolactonase [Arenibacter sp. GZD96]|uniref:6-phosphogluconolactonase n=1 Tax=Aurantibrevibacter litoralis TaxID=3106030 RepID=UPI002B001DF4|nr:6-phosphogluconolactonase [Arenibacter sp. GZD-96]MEA1786914.1 6-phosphogluconolactonase [Arenibacter sp. GZD-96]
MEVKIYDSKEAVAIHFSEYLKAFVATRQKVHIALSGGSTPKIVFDVLASTYKSGIDWSKIYLYWGDERCVPPNDDESNYKMTVTHLVSKIDIPKENIFRIKGENTPELEAASYAALLEKELPYSNGVPQFDLVILGMGDDGHTASIFPHNIHLWDETTFCAVAEHPTSGQKRITLTGSIINNAQSVVFLVTGAGKSQKVREILQQKGDFKTYPASLVAPSSQNLIWFLDTDAARELT